MQTKASRRQGAQPEQRAVQAQPGLAGHKPNPLGNAGMLMSLQRSHGNRYVQRLLNTTLIQRDCGCGAACPDCGQVAQAEEQDRPSLQQKSATLPAFIQAKLTVSQPGDPYEQEADRVAEEVMRMPEPGTVTSYAPIVQRQAISRHSLPREVGQIGRQAATADQPGVDEEEITTESLLSFKEKAGASHDIDADVESQIRAIRGGGEPLSADLKAFFEPRFGVDFSDVRIHTGSAAAETAQKVQARAYTLGSDIAFAPGEFQKDSPESRKLLAHELTHVVQQGSQIMTVMRACACTAAAGSTAPTSTQHAQLTASDFPNLKMGDYCVTAPATKTYNCIAWSIGNTSMWIWKEVDSVYGNKNGIVEIADFDAFYANEGLTPVVDKTPANPQVVLYANGTTPKHAARKIGNGDCAFESKLGRNLRIVHEANQLEGGLYGSINRYYVSA
jgi:hypothetical protein